MMPMIAVRFSWNFAATNDDASNEMEWQCGIVLSGAEFVDFALIDESNAQKEIDRFSLSPY